MVVVEKDSSTIEKNDNCARIRANEEAAGRWISAIYLMKDFGNGTRKMPKIM